MTIKSDVLLHERRVERLQPFTWSLTRPYLGVLKLTVIAAHRAGDKNQCPVTGSHDRLDELAAR